MVNRFMEISACLTQIETLDNLVIDPCLDAASEVRSCTDGGWPSLHVGAEIAVIYVNVASPACHNSISAKCLSYIYVTMGTDASIHDGHPFVTCICTHVMAGTVVYHRPERYAY